MGNNFLCRGCASQNFQKNDWNEIVEIVGRGGTYIEFVKIWVALTIRDFATVSVTARLSWAGAVTLIPALVWKGA
jgi:hypothetical protein